MESHLNIHQLIKGCEKQERQKKEENKVPSTQVQLDKYQHDILATGATSSRLQKEMGVAMPQKGKLGYYRQTKKVLANERERKALPGREQKAALA